MSEQNWKPGDVALITDWLDEEQVALVRPRKQHARQALEFVYRNGFDMVDEVSSARRLVLIDPEDTDAVVRLARAYNAATSDNQIGTLPLQAALREFANPAPPKPEWTDGDVWASDAIVYTRAGGEWFGRGLSTGDAYDGLTDENVDYQVERGNGAVIRKQSEVTP